MTLKFVKDYLDYVESLVDDSISYLNCVDNFDSEFDPEFSPFQVVDFVNSLIFERTRVKTELAKKAADAVSEGTSIIYERLESSMRNLLNCDPYGSSENRKKILESVHGLGDSKRFAYKNDMKLLYCIDISMHCLFNIGDSFEDSMRKYISLNEQ